MKEASHKWNIKPATAQPLPPFENANCLADRAMRYQWPGDIQIRLICCLLVLVIGSEVRSYDTARQLALSEAASSSSPIFFLPEASPMEGPIHTRTRVFS